MARYFILLYKWNMNEVITVAGCDCAFNFEYFTVCPSYYHSNIYIVNLLLWMSVWSRMLLTPCLIPCACTFYVICGNKDISTDWLKINDLARKDERRPSSIKRTLEPFQRRRVGETSERDRTDCKIMGFSERLDTEDERRPSSIKRTLEPFQRRRVGETSERDRTDRKIMGFSERLDAVLNWTQQNWSLL